MGGTKTCQKWQKMQKMAKIAKIAKNSQKSRFPGGGQKMAIFM
jgi:hypothetical protein